MKEMIEQLCKSLEFKLNPKYPSDLTAKYIEVKFSNIHGKHYNGFAFETRIDVDHICSFREITYYEDESKKQEAENSAHERLLDATFCYGVMAAKRELDAVLYPKNPPTNQ